MVGAQLTGQQDQRRPQSFPAGSKYIGKDLAQKWLLILAKRREKVADQRNVIRDGTVQFGELGHRESHPKSCSAFLETAAARTPGSCPRVSATRSAIITTCAGSLRRPLTGCGARTGESVSTSRRSRGTRAATSRNSSAFGKVTLPANDR